MQECRRNLFFHSEQVLLSKQFFCFVVPGHGNQFLNDGINFTPQATAVKLAQLGEGDSPQCGEMSA